MHAKDGRAETLNQQEALRSALGEPEVFAPMDALSAYARASGISLREGSLFGWMSDRAVVEEALRGMFADVGHLCDRLGVDYLPLAAAAVGIRTRDVRVVGEDDEPVAREELLPKPPTVERAGSGDIGDHAGSAQAAVEVYGHGEDMIGDALRHVAMLARAKGVDALKAALAGIGTWSAERRDPSNERPDVAGVVGRDAPITEG